jgi:hypothetical protein
MRFLLQELFPYIVLLYLVDCLTYVEKDQLLFVSLFKGNFRLKRPGFHLVGLCPLTEAFISDDSPVFLSSRGVHLLTGDNPCERVSYRAEDFHFLAYQDMTLVEVEGREVKINGNVFCKTSSSIRAGNLMRLIQKLKGMNPSNRPEEIQAFLAEATDLQKIRALRRSPSDSIFYLKSASSVFFTATFIMLPFVLYSKMYAYFNFHLLLIFMGLNYLSILILAFSLQRRIYDAKIGQAIYALLPILLSPVSAIHVVSKLTREMYARFDPHALAAELLPLDSFRGLIRKELYRIRQTKVKDDSGKRIEFLTQKENSLLALLAQHGTSVHELLAPPKKQDETASSYCPFCRVEYRSGFNTCNDCNVSLQEYG